MQLYYERSLGPPDLLCGRAGSGRPSGHARRTFPEWLVDVILEINAWSKAGGAAEITPTVQDVLGRPATTFRQFARDYADHWKT